MFKRKKLFNKEIQKDIIEIYKSLQELLKEIDKINISLELNNNKINELTKLINTQIITETSKPLKILVPNQKNYNELQEIALGNFGELEIDYANR